MNFVCNLLFSESVTVNFNDAMDKGAFLDQLKNAHVKPIKMTRKMIKKSIDQ